VNYERKYFAGSRSKGVDMKMHCKKARKNISLALDSRLQPAAMEKLQTHLDVCSACCEWQKEQAWFLNLMKTPQAAPQPAANFHAVLLGKINESHEPAKLFMLSAFRPAMLRAAMVLVLIFSAFLGFFLSGRLDATAGSSAAAIFSQTLNLNAYADMPAESFGSVYDRLLQGGLQ
jgi:predicted anti-sigma-YlaC factor YlaD